MNWEEFDVIDIFFNQLPISTRVVLSVIICSIFLRLMLPIIRFWKTKKEQELLTSLLINKIKYDGENNE